MSTGDEHEPALHAPEPLADTHEIDAFASGVPQLDDWLKHRARKNEASGASRTYVVCVGRHVVGYYSLAVGSVVHALAPGQVRRNMPEPIPVMVLGRLAVDQAWQGRGLGRSLLRDAVLRTLQAANVAGIRAILVHAISEEAKRFYQRCGFIESPAQPLTPMITLLGARVALGV